jgi:hypothetical protein
VIFFTYLHWLRGGFLDGAPSHLIMDLCSVHRFQESRKCAADLGVLLHFIPAGWTDEFQPLDRSVFGALKAMCRTLFARHCTAGDDVAVAKSNAVRFLLEARSALEVAVIEKGCRCSAVDETHSWQAQRRREDCCGSGD